MYRFLQLVLQHEEPADAQHPSERQQGHIRVPWRRQLADSEGGGGERGINANMC
jgi:hypothetical protein